MYITLKKTFLLAFLSLFIFTNHAQNLEDKILDAYDTYSEAPREVIYVHLNKSTFVEGEMIGFKAYVFDKFTKQLSSLTTNLYCTISDSTNTILKKKLIHVEGGASSNIFKIDSTLSSGTYTFKAFTNWQKNFPEQNHYQQNFKVISSDLISPNSMNTSIDGIDLQILGEGGHVVYNVINNVGIIAKDNKGNSISNANGFIKDNTGSIVSSFKLNQFGIGKILFKPENTKDYFVTLEGINLDPIKIEDIKPIGFTLAINEFKDGVLASLSTNSASLPYFENKPYKLILHNGSEANLIEFQFEELTKKLSLSKDLLFTGINIFTVFDDKNNPIIERMYFNYDGVKKSSLSLQSVSKKTDSLIVKLKLSDIVKDSATVQDLSISVLPKLSKTYNHPNNILSQTFLQPYIKTNVENPSYYFNDIDRRTKYDMDLLMLTQGWSSYDWKDIFNFNDSYTYEFEQGIDVVANINGKIEKSTYMAYPMKKSNTQIFSLSESDNSFVIESLIPIDDEKLRIGSMDQKKAPAIYPQINLTQIPTFNGSYETIIIDKKGQLSNINIPNIPKAWEKAEKLKEIVITAERAKSRFEKENKRRTTGRLVEITDRDKDRNTPLAAYLNRLGFYADYDYVNATFVITNPRVNWGNNVPLVYLDGALLTEGSFDILANFTLEFIDYLDIELYGMGAGVRGQAGYIKIYTSNDYFLKNSKISNASAEVKFPLTFDSKKRFYTPAYQYTSDFFLEYGAISWHPDLKLNENGELEITFLDTFTENINLHIEGVANDDTFISQTISIKPK